MKTNPFSFFPGIPLGCLLTLVSAMASGQNLETIGKGKVFGLSGGVNASSVFYHANGMESRRDPFNYFLSGNLNISLYGWSVPLSFSYSNQQSAFQQPFNQYGLSPTYKWLTMHAGYRGMTFSNYTMNGHLFLGGGFDIAPTNKVKVSAFYGRLQKAVEEDTTQENNIPVYQRMGGGAKVTLGDQKNNIGLILFKAKDELNSLAAPPSKSDVNPEENLVLGVNFTTALQERITLNGEYASSAITKDTRAEEVKSGNAFDKVHFIFRPRASSSYYHALKAGMTYAFVNAGVGMMYERIDPGYRTLGAYYFNNNLESFAFTGTTTLYQKKLRLNGQLGLQRNNLDRTELNTMNRVSGAINASYQASQRLMMNVTYSNFQTVINFRSQFDYLNQVSPYENLDTLNYRQVAQNANLNTNYVLNESKERRQNVNLNFSFQKTADVQADVEQPTGSRFYNINTNYTLSFNQNLTVNVAANANITDTQVGRNKIYGPSASFRKSFFDKKLSANAALSYNNAYVSGKKTSEVMNIRMSANYTMLEKHQFDISLTRVNRSANQNEIQTRFSELTLQFGYNYNFNVN
jgi:hypothetical protein